MKRSGDQSACAATTGKDNAVRGPQDTFTFLGVGVDASLPWNDLPLTFGLPSALRFVHPVVEDEYVRHIYAEAISRGMFFNTCFLAWCPVAFAWLSSGQPVIPSLLFALNAMAFLVILARGGVEYHRRRCLVDRRSAVVNAYWHGCVDVALWWCLAFLLAITDGFKLPALPSTLMFETMQASVLVTVVILSPWRCATALPAQAVAFTAVAVSLALFQPGVSKIVVGILASLQFLMFCVFAVVFERNRRLQFAQTVKEYRIQEKRQREVDELTRVVAVCAPLCVLKTYVASHCRFDFVSSLSENMRRDDARDDPHDAVGRRASSSSGADRGGGCSGGRDTTRLNGPVAVAVITMDRMSTTFASPDDGGQHGSNQLRWLLNAASLGRLIGIEILSTVGDKILAVAARWDHHTCGSLSMCVWAAATCGQTRTSSSHDPSAPFGAVTSRAVVDRTRHYAIWGATSGSVGLRSYIPRCVDAVQRIRGGGNHFDWSVSTVYATQRVRRALDRQFVSIQRAASRIGRSVRPIVTFQNPSERDAAAVVAMMVKGDGRSSNSVTHSQHPTRRDGDAAMPILRTASVKLVRAAMLARRDRHRKRGAAVDRRTPSQMGLFSPAGNGGGTLDEAYRAACRCASVIGKPFRALMIGSATTDEIIGRVAAKGAFIGIHDSQAHHDDHLLAASRGGGVPLNTPEELEVLAGNLNILDDGLWLNGTATPSTRCSRVLHRLLQYVLPGPFRDLDLERSFRVRTASVIRSGCVAPVFAIACLSVLRPIDRGSFFKQYPSSQQIDEGPAAGGWLIADMVRYAALIWSAASLTFTNLRVTNAPLDALCVVVPFAMYALSFSLERRPTLNGTPFIVTISAALTLSMRNHVRLHFILVAALVLPSTMALSVSQPVDAIVTVVVAVLSYFMCARLECERRRIFLTSEALWHRVASASEVELLLYRGCAADGVALVPTLLWSQTTGVNGFAAAPLGLPMATTSTLQSAVMINIAWGVASHPLRDTSDEGPLFPPNSSTAAARLIATSMSALERDVRHLLRYLSSLNIADASGDCWLVTSSAAASCTGVHADCNAPAAVLSCLAHVSRGALLSVVEAYVFVSRLSSLLWFTPQPSAVSTSSCRASRQKAFSSMMLARVAVHFGSVEFCQPISGSLAPMGADLLLVRDLSLDMPLPGVAFHAMSSPSRCSPHIIAPHVDEPDDISTNTTRHRPLCRVVGTGRYLLQLNAAFEETRHANPRLFASNVKRMRLYLERERVVTTRISRAVDGGAASSPSPARQGQYGGGRAPHLCGSAIMNVPNHPGKQAEALSPAVGRTASAKGVSFSSSLWQSPEDAATSKGCPVVFYPGELVPWIDKGLIFSASRRWAVRRSGEHVGRSVFVSYARHCWDRPPPCQQDATPAQLPAVSESLVTLLPTPDDDTAPPPALPAERVDRSEQQRQFSTKSDVVIDDELDQPRRPSYWE